MCSPAKNVACSASTFLPLLRAYCKKDRVNDVKQLQREMEQRGIMQTPETWVEVIKTLRKAGKMEEAEEALAELVKGVEATIAATGDGAGG